MRTSARTIGFPALLMLLPLLLRAPWAILLVLLTGVALLGSGLLRALFRMPAGPKSQKQGRGHADRANVDGRSSPRSERKDSPAQKEPPAPSWSRAEIEDAKFEEIP